MKKIVLTLVAVLLAFALISCEVEEKTDIVNNDNENENSVDEVLEQDENDEPVNVTLTLYFPDNEALYLHAEQRTLEVHKDENLAATVLEELFKGPESDELSPCLDGEKLVNSVTVSEGLCTVDFDGDFALLNSGGSTRESFAIGAIVNSLCELEDINEVKINIDGDANATFGGHFTLDAPFTPQMDLVQK